MGDRRRGRIRRLSSAIIALPAEHWEAFGATFVLDGSNPDWPQRIALGSASTPLEAVEPFAILDEGEVTTLLIGGTDERRAMRGLAVLFALAAGGCIDLDHDVLQIGIGDELGTAVLGGSSSAAHAAQRLASATLDPTEAVVVLTNNVIVSLDPAGTTPDGRELFTIAQASPLSARIHALAGAAAHVEVLATTRAAVDHGELYVELMRRLRESCR